MTANTIEREIFIEAGLDHVWSLVSKTGFWVGEELRFDQEAQEGQTVVLNTDQYGRFPVRVDRLEPPRYAAYRWASGYPGAEISDENSTLVEFTLETQDDGVMLRVKESGFATLAGDPDFRAARHADNVQGWAAQLERLRAVAEGVAVS